MNIFGVVTSGKPTPTANPPKMDEFLTRLQEEHIHFHVDDYREESRTVEIAVPGERWEVDFFWDGGVEIEIFRSNGEMKDETYLEQLFEKHGSRTD